MFSGVPNRKFTLLWQVRFGLTELCRDDISVLSGVFDWISGGLETMAGCAGRLEFC